MNGGLDEIFDDSHVREEVELLKDHARRHEDVPLVGGACVCCRCITVRCPAELFSANCDAPTVNRLKFIDAAQESRLARAGGADDGEHFTACETEVDAAKDAEVAEGFMNAAHGEHDFVSCHICHSVPPAF